MRVFVCFFAFFGAKIWPAAAGTGELARDLRDQTQERLRFNNKSRHRWRVPGVGRR